MEKAILIFQKLVAKQLLIRNVAIIMLGHLSPRDHFKTSNNTGIFVNHRVIYSLEFIIIIVIYLSII